MKISNRYVPQKLRQEVMKKSKGKCHHCGKKAQKAIINQRGCLQFFDEKDKSFHLDHLHSLAKGGQNELTNLVLSCSRCNLSGRTKVAQNDIQVQKILEDINLIGKCGLDTLIEMKSPGAKWLDICN